MSKITRRHWVAALAAAPAAFPQTQSSEPPADSPEGYLRAARQQQTNTAEQLSKFDLPMATEPAFRFKA